MKKTDSFQTSTPETVTISRAEYEELQAQSRRVSELEGRMNVLMEALRLAQRKRFGASSEKSEDTLSEQLSFLFNEAEVFAEEQRNKEDVTVVAAHKRHKKHEYTLDKIPEDVPVEQVEHRLEGQELVCPQCGGELTEIGKEVINKMKIIPARVVVEQHIYYSYACQHCNKENITTPVVRAPRENRFLPGSFATPEAVAHIMTQKFVMGIPIYRQEQELDRRGIQLSRQTMLCLICSFLSVIGKLLSIVHQLFQPFHFLLCLFPAEIHAGAADRGTHLCYPVINPLVGCVRGIVQLVKA